MFLFDFFRSFLPLHNPVGFGASDFIELALAALLVLLTLVRAEAEPFVQRLAKRTAWCMLALAALPVLLRLALLAHAPAPTPAGSDDFSYWLLADTLRHFRLRIQRTPCANSSKPYSCCSSRRIVPSSRSDKAWAMAAGWLVFGHPWAGVLLSVAALCALTYWMLRAWTTPGWALVGGLLAVMQFGVLSYWVNTYWGGAVSGIAGCLVFGALPRLRGGGLSGKFPCAGRRRAGYRARLAIAHSPVRIRRDVDVRGGLAANRPAVADSVARGSVWRSSRRSV